MRILLAGVLLLTPVQAVAETCDALLPEVQYCSDLRTGSGFITRVSFPDMVKLYYLQDEPLVSSVIVAMPVGTRLLDTQAIGQAAVDQMMGKGTPRFASLSDMQAGARDIDGRMAVRLEFLGRHVDGGIMAAYVVEALQFGDRLLIIYTSDERADAVTDGLRALHTMSLRNLRF